ncbi:MAG: ABC transporter permease [Acidobacteriota bacterium]
MKDVTHVLRSLAKSPGFTVAVVLTLALGIGANTAIFSVVNAVLLRPLPYPDPDRLMVLWENNARQGLDQEQVSAATYLDWRERSDFFEGMAAYRYWGYTLTGGEEPERITSLRVSPALFPVLGSRAELGRLFSPEEESPGNEHVVVLSHGFWARRFGSDPAIVDRTIQLDGEPHTVVGVMPAGFEFPPDDAEVEIWSPLTMSLENLPSRPHRMYNVIGKLRSGASLQQASSEMERIAAGIAEENPQSNRGWGVSIVPAREQMVAGFRTTLLLLQGAVGLVLLIACANIANLLLARASARQKQVAIRATLGAGRMRLLRESLTESLVLATIGGATGLLLAFWGIDLFLGFVPDTMPRLREVRVDLWVLAFTAAFSLASGLVFGLIPALKVMRTSLGEVLKEGGRDGGAGAGRSSRRLLSLMVTAEVALALVLLVGAGLMIRSFSRLLQVDPGFRSDHLVAVAISLPQTKYPESHQQKAFFHQLVDRVRALPGVEAAGAVTALPMSGVGVDFDMPFEIEGRVLTQDQRPRADYRALIPGYFRTMGIPLLKGRLLDDFDRQDSHRVMLVNQAFVRRFFPDEDPVGKFLAVPMAGRQEIVGVVGDVHHHGLDSEVRPEMFVPFQQFTFRDMNIVVLSREDPPRVVADLEEQVWGIDPSQPISDVRTVEELVSQSVAPQRFNTMLLVVLALCALSLAAVGIFGVISYSVAQRTGEIGIRMALGASSADTVKLMVGQASGFILLGVGLGLLGSLGITRLMASLLFGISPTDPGTFLTVALLLTGVGLAASYVPARRATRVDPLVTLRQE